MKDTQTDSREQMKIVIVGHVDHGKSTLVGRIFYDTHSLPEGKYEQIQAQCKRRGMQFEWSFLMDALQAERDQEITIDTTQIWFKTAKRDYVIIDAPGHKEFLKNMISGAAMSEAALLVIDANEGVKEQSKRHGYLLRLLGVEQIAVAINKMDLVNYSEERFQALEAEYRSYLQSIGVTPRFIIPIAAREGDLIVGNSPNMPWYKGPSIIDALDQFTKRKSLTDLPLRFPVQDVYRFDEHQRIFAGRIESGSLRVGDELLFLPSNKTSRIASIENWGSTTPTLEAEAGMSIGVTLTEQIFVERGEVASHTAQAPQLTNLFRARLFWLSKTPLTLGKRYTLKLTTSSYKVDVRTIEKIIDTDALAHIEATQVERNQVAEIIVHVRGLAALDNFSANPILGRFMLMDGYEVVGGGIVDLEGFADQRVANISTSCEISTGYVSEEARAQANGHTGGIIWLTGLPGSGKTTIAQNLERQLFARGRQVFVLNEQRMRESFSEELGHSVADDITLLRRAAAVAGLFARSGKIVIALFASPLASERRFARSIYPERFASVYLKASPATCRTRAVNAEYFEATHQLYETPENADLILDTETKNFEENSAELLRFIEEQFVQPVIEAGIGEGI